MNNNPAQTSKAGSNVGAKFSSRAQTQKAIDELKTAGFLGSEIIVAEDGVSVTVAAGKRGADAERILQAAGGVPIAEPTDAEILAAAEKIQISPTARAAVSVIENAEEGVPPVAPQPHGGDDERSGRLFS